MLEGSVQRAGGESFRVTAQLIDALNGNHVWAESYDRELADIFAVKDEITLNIVANIGAVTEVGERDRAVRNETESLDAWLLWREGRSKFALFQQEENHLARQNFLAALEIDPDFKSAMSSEIPTEATQCFFGATLMSLLRKPLNTTAKSLRLTPFTLNPFPDRLHT